ncbi:MAG: TonB-dependent receptor [Helicobacteraceae bacterium CG2_30_36_10]|nr:MAG: TonB-dependent receptor [Helicobacteraceae bacterium CG2_30_36_10]
MKNKIKLSLALIALTSSLNAQEVITLKPLSVTSTAIATDELKSTDAVEVYTQEDIEKAHVQNVYEFLNSQTSVITMPSYGNPFSQKIDMRGYGIGDGYQNIVITVNGRKINNIDMVAPLLSAISPASISRIEIIKSSGIVVGGDGANAGVINITTKKNNNKEVTLYGGTYGTTSGSFYLGHSDEKLSLSASGEAQKSSGIRHINNDGNKDENKLSTGTFTLAYTPLSELELRAGASFSRTDVLFTSSLTQEQYSDDPTQKGAYLSHQLYDTDTLSGGVSYFIDDALSLNVDASHEKKKSDYIPSWSGPSHYDYKNAKISLDYVSKLLSFSIGYDGFYGERIASDTLFKKQNNAAFIMSEFYMDNSTIKVGYRYETVDYDFADQSLQTNKVLHGAELGYNYMLDKEQSVFANYTHSYQAPDIDRFFAFDSSTFTSYFSGPLNPMEANNYTLGYNNIQKGNKFKISVCYIDLKDEIYYLSDYSGPRTSINTNINKSHKYGVDIYDKYIISGMWNVALNYNYVQAIIDEEKNYSGNFLPGVSDHNVKATLSYLPNPHATFALTQIYRSEAYAADDFNNDFSQKQDAYKSTDISVTYAKDNYEIFAKINNLFNQKNGLWISDDAIYPVNFTTTAIAGVKLKY